MTEGYDKHKMELIETESVELKKSTSELKEAVISIAAILNKHKKGELFFGIKDNGEVVGQNIGQNTIRDISKTISDNIEPKLFPKITQKKINGKNCIHVVFSGDEMPYFAYGRAYIRVGDEDKKLSTKELENLILKKNKDMIRWESQICKHATIDDLDDNIISQFVELAKKSKRINIGHEDKELILKKLNLVSGKKITNAAVLLFGTNPNEFFMNNTVKCGRFKGVVKDKFIDMKDFNSNLFDNLDKSFLFFQDHLRLGAKNLAP